MYIYKPHIALHEFMCVWGGLQEVHGKCILWNSRNTSVATFCTNKHLYFNLILHKSFKVLFHKYCLTNILKHGGKEHVSIFYHVCRSFSYLVLTEESWIHVPAFAFDLLHFVFFDWSVWRHPGWNRLGEEVFLLSDLEPCEFPSWI